jgi:ankyrin repeat protein
MSDLLLLQCAVQLLEYKADLHKQNKNGANALYFACRSVYTAYITKRHPH